MTLYRDVKLGEQIKIGDNWRVPHSLTRLWRTVSERSPMLGALYEGPGDIEVRRPVIPRWRKPEDRSQQLFVGDRVVAIALWADGAGGPVSKHVLTLTITEDGTGSKDNEGVCYSLEDCECWMPESEFLSMFGPEVQL